MPARSGRRAGSSAREIDLHRQLVAVRRRRDLERVDDPRQEREVVRGRRQLDQSLHAVSLLDRVEDRLIDAVREHELALTSSRRPLRRAAPTWAAHTYAASRSRTAVRMATDRSFGSTMLSSRKKVTRP